MGSKLTDLDPWDPENDETLRAAWDEWETGYRDWVESLQDLDDCDEEDMGCLTMRILILARQERIEIEEDGDYMGGCGFNCESCPDGTWDDELGDWLCGAWSMYDDREAWGDEDV